MAKKIQNNLEYRGIGLKIKLAEPSMQGDALNKVEPKELQLFKAGVYYHDQYGKIEITPDILKKMVLNFNDKVRGIDIALDYKHDSEAEAAAWIESIYTKENDSELWFKPRWTPNGKDKILSEEYKYISPDFTLSYVDNEKLTNHGPVLLGAGLTNRPFIKRMSPITLSEEYKMDELEKLKQENELLKAENAKLKAAASGEGEAEMAEKNKAALADAEKKLAESEAEVKKLSEEKKLSDKNKEFDLMLSEGKACEAQRKAFIDGNMSEFAKNFKPLNLSEKGHAKHDDVVVDKDADVQDQVLKLAEAKIKENKKLDLGEAVKMVLSEKPELNKEYKKKFN